MDFDINKGRKRFFFFDKGRKRFIIKIFKYFVCFFYIYLEILKIKTRVNKKKRVNKSVIFDINLKV